MDQEVLSIIKSQTGENDEQRIESIYKAKNNNVIDTIVHISNLIENKLRSDNNMSKPSIFDEIRKIVEEKENIYQNRNKHI